jgi:hypothetical protein
MDATELDKEVHRFLKKLESQIFIVGGLSNEAQLGNKKLSEVLRLTLPNGIIWRTTFSGDYLREINELE